MKYVAKQHARAEITQAEAILAVKDLSVTLDQQPVLHEITFELYPGELLAILGASGSGKTTLLNTIAGFLAPEKGSIYLAGELVSQPGAVQAPEKRHLGMVFQSYALWPHMSVLENVAFPLRRQGMSKAISQKQASTMLARLDLEAYATRYPSELSGGQQQRVGLARALAAQPRLFLFDEPTANLDSALKASFAQEIRRQQQESQVAALYVTHDVREAFAVADRVMILQSGHIEQLGRPMDIYECPATQEIAGLCGLYTLLPGRLEANLDAGNAEVTIEEQRYTVKLLNKSCQPGSDVVFMLRPEWGEIITGNPPARAGIAATIARIEYQGSQTEYDLETTIGKIYYRALGRPLAQVGQEVQWYPRCLYAYAPTIQEPA
ncbi:ABC transporter ATP-binding protein [Ktedonosporobacter rubrisoli]|uniref:ABC-type quaternary amine transporter n=1 Tax=Ktedonosporobacter rubrisoli TaxID=2509675 RepID=A0A4V0Z098_KTERU|nr:ABC transporter ATP-binding protein [Ktedonosporobacter rubrisoli]QBD82471.1 ABC transporter ATP-binding protein [Ktedonosporobacter rubrisoli]